MTANLYPSPWFGLYDGFIHTCAAHVQIMGMLLLRDPIIYVLSNIQVCFLVLIVIL